MVLLLFCFFLCSFLFAEMSLKESEVRISFQKNMHNAKKAIYDICQGRSYKERTKGGRWGRFKSTPFLYCKCEPGIKGSNVSSSY